jgi:hypothetical protein
VVVVEIGHVGGEGLVGAYGGGDHADGPEQGHKAEQQESGP